MTEIHLRLIRHATGSHMDNPELIAGRSIDAKLVEGGKKEADAKGEELVARGIVPDKMVASSAKRCIETGRCILGVMRLEMEIEESDDLLEMDQGNFVGRKRTDVYTDEIKAQIREKRKDFALPGGESMNQVGRRGFNWLRQQELLVAQKKLSIVAIAHGGLITHTVGRIENWDQPKSLEMLRSMPPVGETHLVFDGSDWHVVSFAQPIQDI